MSLEHELAELSTVYHGQRERMEALEQLVREAQFHMELYQAAIEATTGLMYAVRAPRLPEIEAWQQRARELLGEKEP